MDLDEARTLELFSASLAMIAALRDRLHPEAQALARRAQPR
jgi:hypothetical protein